MKRSALLLSLLPLSPVLLQAQLTVPAFMSYQGRVTDAAGVGLGTGTPVNRKIIFRLYDSSTGTAKLWTEEQTVTIADGEFSVLLGQGIQATGSASTEAHPALNTVFGKTGDDRYLGITVDGGDGVINASDTELTPRQRLGTTAYAMRAASADSVVSGSDLQLNGSANYGLGWYGTGRDFNGLAVDGPVLYGAGGGVLGLVSGSTKTPVLRWDASGKVGIGTGAASLTDMLNTKLVIQGDDANTPAQQLSIRGNTNPAKRLNIGYNTTTNVAHVQSWSASGVASALALNPSAGSVGIGTSSPTALLDVNGTLKASSLSLGTGALTAGSVNVGTGALTAGSLGLSGGLTAGGDSTITGKLTATGKLVSNTSVETTGAVLAGGTAGFSFTSNDLDGGMYSPADGVIQFKTNNAERMRIDTTNATFNVDVTTKNADGKQTVLNRDSLNATQLNANNVRIPNTLYINYAGGPVSMGESGITDFYTTGKVAAGGIESGFTFKNGDMDGGMYSPADGVITIRTNNVEKMRVTPSGLVGIGTKNPVAQLDVDGASPITNTSGGYWNINPPAVWTGGGGNPQNYSIRASNWVLAQAYWTFSDERLKEKLGYSDSSADLDTMMQLKIADYRFKDKVRNGAAEQKKVIAQDVEKVFPQAVTRSPGVIPDIFRKVPVDQEGWITLSANLKKGDQVRLIGKDGDSSQHEVLDATADKFQTGYKTTEAEVFVYGRQVDDLRTVDYEALAMLNLSATQEIVHRLEAKSNEVTALNARLAALEARDKERDDQMARLEKLVLASQNGNSGKDASEPPAARTVALQQLPQQQAKAAE